MNQIDSIVFNGLPPVKRLELLQGDITAIDPADPVDVLIVSAFPRDYTASHGSVVGALKRKHVDIQALSLRPKIDLRNIWKAWLSEEMPSAAGLGFRHILVFEPERSPGEDIDALFRALLGILRGKALKVATPLVGCGDRGGTVETLLPKFLDAAIHWLSLSSLAEVRIVELSETKAAIMRKIFDELEPKLRALRLNPQTVFDHDVFLSYQWDNKEKATALKEALRSVKRDIRIFQDEEKLRTGDNIWANLDAALRTSAKFVPLFSPAYVRSSSCLKEFNTALGLHNLAERTSRFLHPLCIEKVTEMPERLKEVKYEDWTESNISGAAAVIVSSLERGFNFGKRVG
jgi:hypothetical protein